MDIDLSKLKDLLELLEERDVAEFEHEKDGARVKVVLGREAAARVALAPAYEAPRPAVPPPTVSGRLPVDDDENIDVTSPFVGTFYRQATPDAPPFVEIGSVVRPGQALCIIEAMKLMNEIEAELSGTVTEIYAQNGKSVEFGQKILRIKKA